MWFYTYAGKPFLIYEHGTKFRNIEKISSDPFLVIRITENLFIFIFSQQTWTKFLSNLTESSFFFFGIFSQPILPTREGENGRKRVVFLQPSGSEIPDRRENKPSDKHRLLEDDRERQGDLQQRNVRVGWDEEDVGFL